MSKQEALSRVETKKPGIFYGYWVVGGAFGAILVMFGTFYTFGVFFKPVSTEFGWTRAATAGAFLFYAAFHGALFSVTGKLTDRFGPRLVTTVCGFFLGLGYILMSQVNALWQLYFFYGILVAIGMSGSLVPLLSTVARWFVKRQGLMAGIVTAGMGVGQVIFPPLASRLIVAYNWRTAYIIVGSLSLILIVLVAQLLRRDPAQVGQLAYGAEEATGKGSNPRAGQFSLREALSTRQFWQFFTLLFSSFFCVGIIVVHLVPHATELGMSPTSAANVLATVGMVSIAGRVIMGGAADRISGRLSLVIVCLFMSVALLGFIAAKEIWMLYLLGAIFGFGLGGVVSLQSPILAQLFGLSSHGTIFGVISFSASLGSGVGPVVAGGIFDTRGSYGLAFLIAALLSLVSLILALFLKPTRKPDK